MSDRCRRFFSASFFDRRAERADTRFPALTDEEAMVVRDDTRCDRTLHCDARAEIRDLREAMSVSCAVTGSGAARDGGLNLTVCISVSAGVIKG